MSKDRDPRLDSDPDYILLPKAENSLAKLLDQHPNGVPDAVICKALKISREELEETYARAILKLRKHMQVDNDE